MEELANHVIAVSQENNLSVSNLELQKILYFTLRNSRNVLDEEEIKDTYDEPFLAWPYGPVTKSASDKLDILDILLHTYNSERRVKVEGNQSCLVI